MTEADGRLCAGLTTEQPELRALLDLLVGASPG